MEKIKDQSLTLIFSLIYCTSMTLVGAFGAFNVIKVPEMNPQYADLRLITSSSECSIASKWTISDPTCDPWGRLYNYPSLWVKIFSLFGISQEHTIILGTIEILLLTLLVSYWLYFGRTYIPPESPKLLINLLVVTFAISPPILLLMERGNVDTLMFAGISFAVVLNNRGHKNFAVGILIFLGALKIYPLAGIAFFLFKKISFRKSIAYSLLTLISIFSIFGDLKYIVERSETTWNTVSYGVSLVPLGTFRYFGIDESKSIALFCGYSLLVASVIFFRRYFSDIICKTQSLLRVNLAVWNTFGIFSIIFLASFLMGTAFDYRMILLLPIFVVLIISAGSGKERLGIFCVMLVPMFGGHYAPAVGVFGELINYFSDLFMLIGAAWLINLLIPIKRNTLITE